MYNKFNYVSYTREKPKVIKNFEIDTKNLNEQFTKRIMSDPDEFKKIKENIMSYPEELLTFPQDIEQEFADKDHRPISFGLKLIDDFIVTIIGWVWMIFSFDQLFNVVILTSIKWALFEYWNENDCEYFIKKQDPTMISNAFNPNQLLEPVSPEREFDLQEVRMQKSRIRRDGSREAVIKRISDRRTPGKFNGLESRYSEEGKYRFLRSLSHSEMKEIVVHTAIRVTSEFIKMKITRVFNGYQNKPKNIYDAKSDNKFKNAMIKATPSPQELIKEFAKFASVQDEYWLFHRHIQYYWSGPAIVDQNIINKVRELNVDFNRICYSIAKENMECMYALFVNLVNNPGNYKYTCDNAITLLLNKYWNNNEDLESSNYIDDEEKVLH